MRKLLSVIYVSLLMSLGAASTAYADDPANNFDYRAWKDVLARHVDSKGFVNYKGLFDDRASFDTFIDQVENADISRLSDAATKAFWINAYNAITIDIILRHYPIGSIRFVNFGLVWQLPRRVAGGRKSLGNIEHKILRPMGDPRIHFAINCASVGCPALLSDPYAPQMLDEQLDAQARRFINDPAKVRLDKDKNILYVSSIFSWFKDDFAENEQGLINYIKRYLDEPVKSYIDTQAVRLKFLDYNWDLNKQ